MQSTSDPPLKVAPLRSNIGRAGSLDPAPADALRVVTLGQPGTPLYLPVSTVEDAPAVIFVNRPVVVNLAGPFIIAIGEMPARNLQSLAATCQDRRSSDNNTRCDDSKHSQRLDI